jgi:hypothetical protein
LLQAATIWKTEEFKRAPKEIQAQYPETVLSPEKARANMVIEDPNLVADMIVEQLTVFSPVLNNYPGKIAKSMT